MIEIENRRSIRQYLNQPVEKEKIDALLHSAMLAPSGNNTQPWHWILVDDEQVKGEVVRVSHNQEWMLSAPVLIVCVADARVRLQSTQDVDFDELSSPFELKQIIRDTAIAIDHITLEAVHQGLGTCWVAFFKQNDIRPVLGIPHDKYVVAVLTVGYPAEEPKPRPRKALQTVLHYNRW